MARKSYSDPYDSFRFILWSKEANVYFSASRVESIVEFQHSHLLIERALRKEKESLGQMFARIDIRESSTLHVFLLPADQRAIKLVNGRVVGASGVAEDTVTVRQISVKWSQYQWVPLHLDATKSGKAMEAVKILYPEYTDQGEVVMRFSTLTKDITEWTLETPDTNE